MGGCVQNTTCQPSRNTWVSRMSPLPKKLKRGVIILPVKTKDARIKAEEKKLRKSYKDLPKDKIIVVDGLIKRAAFMKITLEDMEEDLDAKGFVEMFSQSDKTDPYERERPVARLYNTMNKNYQSIIKGLSDHLPKEIKIETDDGFEDFVASRGN
jgi:hypothetical protein